MIIDSEGKVSTHFVLRKSRTQSLQLQLQIVLKISNIKSNIKSKYQSKICFDVSKFMFQTFIFQTTKKVLKIAVLRVMKILTSRLI